MNYLDIFVLFSALGPFVEFEEISLSEFWGDMDSQKHIYEDFDELFLDMKTLFSQKFNDEIKILDNPENEYKYVDLAPSLSEQQKEISVEHELYGGSSDQGEDGGQSLDQKSNQNLQINKIYQHSEEELRRESIIGNRSSEQFIVENKRSMLEQEIHQESFEEERELKAALGETEETSTELETNIELKSKQVSSTKSMIIQESYIKVLQKLDKDIDSYLSSIKHGISGEDNY